jgi:hypothetical protein
VAGYCKQGDEDCFKDKLKQSFDKFELCKGRHDE